MALRTCMYRPGVSMPIRLAISGQDSGSVLEALTGLLPMLVDQATPEGEASLQSGQQDSLLGGLAGMLGKL